MALSPLSFFDLAISLSARKQEARDMVISLHKFNVVTCWVFLCNHQYLKTYP